MHPIMAELLQDHVNLSRLLELLDRHIEIFRSGEPPDYLQLLGMVEYVESYPDLIHHPREDIIFRIYLERHRRGEDCIRRLLDEHRSLIEQSRALRYLLEQTLQGSVSPRATVEESLRGYVDAQRAHLNAEEAEVFDLMNDALNADEWARIQLEIPVSSDPLFGGAVQKRYQAIFEQIMALS